MSAPLSPKLLLRRMSGPPLWSREQAIQALLAEYEKTGRPPSSFEWVSSARGRPNYNTIKRMFGDWKSALRAAGILQTRRQIRNGEQWTAERIHTAVFRWNYLYGRLPRAMEWNRAQTIDGYQFPTYAMVKREFGTWPEMLESGGWEPTRRANKQRFLEKAA